MAGAGARGRGSHRAHRPFRSSATSNSRPITADDVPRLTYVQCIIREMLRLYSLPPMLLPHESSADCKVDGYNVLRGTMLFVNVYVIHYDPAVWEEPEKFMSERFEDGKCDDSLLIPFGMGRRRCPDETLPLCTVGLVIGTLIQCFDWERVDGVEVGMTESGRLTIPKVVPLEAMCTTTWVMFFGSCSEYFGVVWISRTKHKYQTE